jgi:hypothetical protein
MGNVVLEDVEHPTKRVTKMGSVVSIAPTGLPFPDSEPATLHSLLARANDLRRQNSN